ncbi:MAG: nucleotidyl transferase AbiEii/AbiGii toxin family protein [Deltaproteobacteria bacterium]|nr:nucleotidyl transferase AbiEii/AbiGii toxin family protein [Deltaproteobacteria bacterium]
MPIWGISERQLALPHAEIQCAFPVVDDRELWAGKITAAMLRAEPRDLYDLACMPEEIKGSTDLRRTTLLLASGARHDLRTVHVHAIEQLTFKKIEERLYPVIRAGGVLAADRLKENACKIITMILNFKEQERNYLDLLLDQGDYQPEHLFPEKQLLERVRKHPVLLWKAKNVREFKRRDP